MGWVNPLDRTYPTLAEYLGSRGYATAGFVANTLYCATDSGLDRGFTTYRDYLFPRLTALQPAVLVDRTLAGFLAFEDVLENQLGIDVLRPAAVHLELIFSGRRKDAATVNREFFDWLARRERPDRPFFAFLNDYDAHWPYQLPPLSVHRFGMPPRDAGEASLIRNWFALDKRGLTRPGGRLRARRLRRLRGEPGRADRPAGRRAGPARPAREHLADRAGRPRRELRRARRGVLPRDEPLPHRAAHPAGDRAAACAARPRGPASGRDGEPARPGRHDREPRGPRGRVAVPRGVAGAVLGQVHAGQSGSGRTGGRRPALSEVVPEDPLNHDPDRLLERRWPLAALCESDWTYIRREGDVQEEVFHLPDDALETRNRAADPSAQASLERMRAVLGGLTGGPLTPQRFNP